MQKLENVMHSLWKENISKKEILENCLKSKVYNYYLNKNLCLVFFEDADEILFGVFEISCQEIIQ